MSKSLPVCHSVYLIGNGNRTYVGYSSRWRHRLRQHNCEITGGARYTSNFRRPGHRWHPLLVIEPLPSKSEALSLEWWCKHAPRCRSPYRVSFRWPEDLHEPLKQSIAERRLPGIWKALVRKNLHTNSDVQLKFFDPFFATAFQQYLHVTPRLATSNQIIVRSVSDKENDDASTPAEEEEDSIESPISPADETLTLSKDEIDNPSVQSQQLNLPASLLRRNSVTKSCES